MLLKGKARPTKLIALVGDEATAASESFNDLAQRHVRLLMAIAAALSSTPARLAQTG